VNDTERHEAIERAARRVLDAFTAYGTSAGVVDNARAHQECEAAMTDLAYAVDGPRYGITPEGARAAMAARGKLNGAVKAGEKE